MNVKPQVMTKRQVIWMTPAMLAQIECIATDQGRFTSEVIRELIEIGLQSRGSFEVVTTTTHTYVRK